MQFNRAETVVPLTFGKVPLKLTHSTAQPPVSQARGRETPLRIGLFIPKI